MVNIWAIARREVQCYFASPVGYVVLGFFLFLYGYFFYDYLNYFMNEGYGFETRQVWNLNEHLIRALFYTTSIILVFLVPLMTMRTFAEERRSDTIELLLTSPVTDLELVLGKFFGALTLFACMLALTGFHMAILFFFGDPEWQPLLVGYLGMLLLGGAFIAFGLFFSSLTENQIIAGFLSFGTFLFLWLIETVDSWSGPAASLLVYLSVISHMEEFSKGVIDTRDVVYYLSFIALGLFLCKQSVESYRWRG